jgi:hypothetical protein
MTSGLIEACSNATHTKNIKRQLNKIAGSLRKASGNDAFGQHPCQIGSTTATGNLTGAPLPEWQEIPVNTAGRFCQNGSQ